ncbi:MAG TPA: DotU family type IV/VI secretion system protein [Pyrinomonadaceae bacterium]|jgi:type VI secretion system protein ImpK|nr:DotU family type IV/VI secretion system protein [Pyrinomonadaceae bacterium]
MKEYGDTFLLAPFREFYREVIRLRRMVVTGAWAAAPNAVPATADGAEGESVDLKSPAGTWVYFPDVIPEREPETSTSRGAAWVSPPSGAQAPWENAHAHDANAPTPPASNGNGSGNGSNGNTQLAPTDGMRASTFVWQRLVSLFERHEAQAWRYGGTYGAEFYKEAQYVMVALADEIFLNTQWEGHRSWVSNLLESKIFRTHVAGELFFQRLDRMLVERDPVYRDLAAVYLMALSLGFRGKYRGRDDRGQLEHYRRQLFHFVFRREPELDSPRQMFPEAYYHTLRDETKRRLQNPRAWIILLCAVVVAYVALTHGIWSKLTGRLFEVNERIHKTVDRMGNGL